jgi:TRAP transporter TAXI family solute receptor
MAEGMSAVLYPDEIAARLPMWLRIVLVGCVVLVATGASLFGYRYFTTPTTLTVAAGSVESEATRYLTAIASRLASTNSPVRLKVIDAGSALAAAKEFSAGKVNLAVVRADFENPSDARTVVLLAYTVVLIVAPGTSIESMGDLKGKTVGVGGGEVNHAVVQALTKEYDLARQKVQFKDLAIADIEKALQSKQVSALLVVMPLSEKYLSILRNVLQMNAKRKATLIPIEAAGAIANFAPAFESFEVPKGTLRGSPPIPDDDLTTLRVPFYLVAHKKLDADVVTNLTRAIIDTRRELIAEFPLMAQVVAPSTDNDAYIPIHPGAAAFYDGTQQDFFDKYSNALYFGPVVLGGLASLLAALWKFIGANKAIGSPLEPLYALAGEIRKAGSEVDLVAIEEKLDNILKSELSKYAKGELQAGDAAGLSLAAHRLEYLISYRRSQLDAGHPFSPRELSEAIRK